MSAHTGEFLNLDIDQLQQGNLTFSLGEGSETISEDFEQELASVVGDPR